MNQIQLIFRIPAATDPSEVTAILHGYVDENDEWVEAGGIPTVVPPGGIMPASAQSSGSALVHCLCYTEDFAAIQAITQAQRPVWQIFYAGEMFQRPNPAYDPEDEESNPLLPVVEHAALNVSVWQFVPDRIVYDDEGNPVGSEQVNQLHQWLGGNTLQRV